MIVCFFLLKKHPAINSQKNLQNLICDFSACIFSVMCFCYDFFLCKYVYLRFLNYVYLYAVFLIKIREQDSLKID